MKKRIIRILTAASVVMLCVLLAGCGCGKKKDPASQQVLKISITPEPSPTPEPEKMNQDAVVTNDGVTMVNEYLIQKGQGEPAEEEEAPEKEGNGSEEEALEEE